MIKIAVLGLGTVGSEVVRNLSERQSAVSTRLGTPIQVKSIYVRNLQKNRSIDTSGFEVTDSIDSILNDPEISIIVEAMGGIEPANTIIRKAFAHGKHVVTANKDLVSQFKSELMRLSREHKVGFYFEAAVCGGIPILQALKLGYAGNDIQEIVGILNGTTNYILTQIEEAQLPFKKVLKKAQELGFAESDPTNDVSGLDAAYKLDILAALGFGIDVGVKNFKYSGIESITLKDILYAQRLNRRIKLLGIAKRLENGQISMTLGPVMIKKDHPLAMVRNEYNAVFINGSYVGETMLLGKGAGGKPTASAMVADVLLCASQGKQPSKVYFHPPLAPATLASDKDIESKFYLRLTCQDDVGVFEHISHTLSKNHVSIEKVIQDSEEESEFAEVVIVTHKVQLSNMHQACQNLKKLPAMKRLEALIQVGI